MRTEMILTLTILLFGTFKYAQSECGTERLTTNSWRQQYLYKGKTPKESCKWTFDSPISRRSVLMLRIRSLAYTTSRSNAYLTLPNGTIINRRNQNDYERKCLKFVRKGFKSTGCLERLKNTFCSATITEVDIWPPTLSSSVDYSFKNRAGEYVYPVRFIYEYQYLECPNGTYIDDSAPTAVSCQENYYASTVILGILTVFFFLIAASTSYLLWKKSKNPSEENPLPLSGKNNNSKEESVYENPNNPEAELISPRNEYSKIEKRISKEDDENSTYAIIPAANQPGQVVQNVLYHSYENTNTIPVPKQA